MVTLPSNFQKHHIIGAQLKYEHSCPSASMQVQNFNAFACESKRHLEATLDWNRSNFVHLFLM